MSLGRPTFCSIPNVERDEQNNLLGHTSPIRQHLTMWGYNRTSRICFPHSDYFKRAQAGGTAILHSELLEDLHQVLLHGGFAHAKDRADIGVRLTLSHPEQHFGSARRKSKFYQRFGGG